MYCLISEISITPTIAGNPRARPPLEARETRQTTGTAFQINNAKLHVPVVTLSINDNIKFPDNIKQEFKITISRNKYRFEITTQPKNNFDYLIDRTFRNINRSFVLSFKNGDDDPARDSFDECYMPLVEIKDINALIDSKPFFDQAVKTNKKHMKNLLKCQEMLTIQHEIYLIICIIRNIITLLALIYQDKQIRVFLNKLILQEN